jgi:tetratricopeptide (TPR) repeat protein
MDAYAGLASTAVAEQYRRMRRPQDALAAYGRAMALWEEAARDDVRQAETARAAAALARAARARVLYQLGRDGEALEEMLTCFQGAPEAAGTRDGMGITPGETAQMLYARLKTGGQEEAAQRLEVALKAIDPELLRPDRE